MNTEPDQRKIYGVTELTRLIKATIEDEVGEVWVEGEVSNLRRPASGHWYFTVKDETAQLAAVMFRGDQRAARCEPKDGVKIRVFGLISVYEKSGQYQLVARALETAGIGSLQAAFEALKKKLAAEGLFEQKRKKTIPRLPRHIGLVTSPTGAAIHDILHVMARRFSNLHVVLAPVRVQGAEAAAEIAAAIDLFNAEGKMDVLIVGRGGGSLEDLAGFNAEIVARAAARSAIPLISAVGHETDFTILDFVADLRAPTPSAAAELVVGRKVDFEAHLADLARRLTRAARGALEQLKSRFAMAQKSYVFREPRHLVRQTREKLRNIFGRLAHNLRGRTREQQQALDELTLRLRHAVQARAQARQADLRRLQSQLQSLSPLAVLARGYSITFRQDGRILKSAAQTQTGERIMTRLASGRLESDVVRRHENQ